MNKWLKSLFKDLYADSSKIDPQRRAQINKILIWASGVIIALFIGLVAYASHIPTASESPFWQAVISARLTAVRLVAAVPVILLGFGASLFLFNVVENSRLGKQFLEPQDGDSEEMKARKISNSGILIAALCAAILNSLVQSLLK